LSAAGVPLWGANRPAVLVWLAVDQDGRRELIGPEGASGLLAPLEQRAAARGLPLVMPLLDLEDTGIVSSDSVWNLDQATVARASKRYAHDAVLLGRVLRSASGQWHGQWQLQMQMQDLQWSDQVAGNSAAEAVQGVIDAVAQRLAERYSVQGT